MVTEVLQITQLVTIMWKKALADVYTVRPNKKETRFISEISSLPRKI